MSNPSLDLHRLTESVYRNPAFAEGLSRKNMGEMNEDERRAARRKAVARSALSLSQQRKNEKGPYDLDAHLYQLIATAEPFFQTQSNIDDFRRRTDGQNWY